MDDNINKSYELQWLEAERQLALLEYENYVRLQDELNWPWREL